MSCTTCTCIRLPFLPFHIQHFTNSRGCTLPFTTAYMFVSLTDDKLLNLDPHYCQVAVSINNSEFDIRSYHCNTPRKLSASKMDPSCTIGFFCREKEDFHTLRRKTEPVSSGKEGGRKEGREGGRGGGREGEGGREGKRGEGGREGEGGRDSSVRKGEDRYSNCQNIVWVRQFVALALPFSYYHSLYCQHNYSKSLLFEQIYMYMYMYMYFSHEK